MLYDLRTRKFQAKCVQQADKNITAAPNCLPASDLEMNIC